jgi:ubiquinone/menaquinone biosynthesis C-methylase UbiE
MDTSDGLFAEWNLYDTISRSNYMRQQEISAAIRKELKRTSTPLKVLDLGCGDGWSSSMILAESVVDEYIAVDLSESAMERLARRPPPGVRPETAHRQLIRGDIATELHKMADAKFNVIHAGYSLHHYTTEAKLAVLDDLVRVLGTDRRLFWTDVVRGARETRDAFIERLGADVHVNWLAIAPAERNSVIKHMITFDYPEPESWMVREMERRGLYLCERLFRDEFYASYVFKTQS